MSYKETEDNKKESLELRGDNTTMKTNIKFKWVGIKIQVYLDNKIVGHIKRVEKGWQYFVKNKKISDAKIFPTSTECQKSLL